MLNKGLNSFQIKIIALILMILDHIHYTFGSIVNVPIEFTMLGRLSAPLFIFITAQSMYYTKNPKKYLLRLWIGSVVMGIGNQWINNAFPLPNGGIIFNNIFATLFIICLIIFSIQQINYARKEHKPYLRYILLMLLPVLSSIVLLVVMYNPSQIYLMKTILLVMPSLLFCEGGIVFVALGVGLYLCHQNKKKMSLFYIVLCSIVFLMGYNPEIGFESILQHNIQWMMLFALPIILAYNNQKGYGMKYFFYIFYPVHIYLLAILANSISK